MKNSPIFVTGIERSGASMIARILSICGVFTGDVNVMQENIRLKRMLNDYLSENPNNELIPETNQLYIPVEWESKVRKVLSADHYVQGKWMYKDSHLIQTWPIWHYAFPNARWIIVRRRTPDIIKSCMKTGFMKTFKDTKNLELIKAKTEEEGWLWWVHQYENRIVEMIKAGVNCTQVWPERMVTHDYQQIYQTLEWLGLEWNDKIIELIDPMLEKSRRD